MATLPEIPSTTARRRRSFSAPAATPLLALSLLLTALTLVVLAPAPAAGQGANLELNASFLPSTIGPGSDTTLRLRITNPNGFPVRDLSLANTLPGGMTVSGAPQATNTCGGTLSATAGDGSFGFGGGSIGAGSACVLSVNVSSSTPGTHTHVTGDLLSELGNSGSASAALTVATDRPGFSKAFSPSSVLFGGRSTLTFTIDNSANDGRAVNLTFTDALPLGLVVASPSNASTTCGGGLITAVSGSSTVSYAPMVFLDASVEAGQVCTLSVDVLGNSVGALQNTSGELTSLEAGPTRSSGKAGATLTVTNDRLTLSKTFVDDPVPPGRTGTLRFTLRNLDRSNAAANLSFTDDLDAVLSGLSAVGLPAGDPCGSGSSLTGTGALTLAGGSLAAGESCTFEVTFEVPASAAPGAYPNTTSAVSGDLGGRPVTASAASDLLVVEAVPVLTSAFVDSPVGAGGSATLEFTLTNTSLTETLTAGAFSDTFEDIFRTASSVPTSDFCGAGSNATFVPYFDTGSSPNLARLVVSGATLAPGDSCTFSLVLGLVSDAPTGPLTDTTSGVTAQLGSRTVSGAAASAVLEIVGAPELTKTFVGDPVSPGGTVTLELTLSLDELAPGSAADITFSDDLDAALSGLVATGLPLEDVCGVGSRIQGTMTVLLTGASLAPGESCTVSVPLAVPADALPGSHLNVTSAVSATVAGVAALSPAARDELDVVGLTLAKEFVDDPVFPGGAVTLEYTIANDSLVAATAITFQDDYDDALPGLAATLVPPEPCGAGSSLVGLNANRRVVLVGAGLDPGASCTFSVTLAVPASAVSDTYSSTTAGFSANISGQVVAFDDASADLVVDDDLLDLAKSFLDDPVGPGETVTLRFVVTNLSASETVTAITFTDDLTATLAGLESLSGAQAEVCGAGSLLDGTSLLTLSGASLAPGTSCTVDVVLLVPVDAPLGTVATNVTSDVTGLVGAVPVSGPSATDTLRLNALELTKTFGEETVHPGDPVTLTFTLRNLSASETFSRLAFSDDLAAMLAGLEAVGLPLEGPCGEGSLFDGTTFLTLTGASLLPGGSCSFHVDLVVPEDAEAGTYENVTSEVFADGFVVGGSAADTLEVEVVVIVDSDGDGVLDGDDACPGTVIPEGVPTDTLGTNRFALVDGDTTFDTVSPPGGGPGASFTTEDTAGCSCEQIIAAQGLGKGHTKRGCSLGAMRDWVDLVN